MKLIRTNGLVPLQNKARLAKDSLHRIGSIGAASKNALQVSTEYTTTFVVSVSLHIRGASIDKNIGDTMPGGGGIPSIGPTAS